RRAGRRRPSRAHGREAAIREAGRTGRRDPRDGERRPLGSRTRASVRRARRAGKENWTMGRGLRAIILGLTVVAAVVLAAGLAESAPGETGGRPLGSRIAAGLSGNHVCAVKEDGT